MFNLREELRSFPWIEQAKDSTKRTGVAELEDGHSLRTFTYEKGVSHEMRYGGEDDVHFTYETIRLTTSGESWHVITLTQKYYDDEEQEIEISLDALPDKLTIETQREKKLAVGAVLPVTYSLHSDGKLPELGATWRGEEKDQSFLQQGLITQLMLPQRIDVDATARNILCAARDLDFNLQPRQLLVPMPQ